MRIKRSYLQNLLNRIGEMSGQATAREQAIAAGKDGYLFLDYAPIYGGYRVEEVRIPNGARYDALGKSSMSARLSGREMELFLEGYINGLRFAAENLNTSPVKI